jgi:carbon starvation protein CstA
MAIVYRSKIDSWLVAVVILSLVICAVALFAVASTAPAKAIWVSVVVCVVAAALPVWLLFSTSYTIESKQLVVKSGPFRWRIPVADITEIVATSNALSSPALSLDRLRISYGHGRVLMVSPRNTEQFLQDIGRQKSAV